MHTPDRHIDDGDARYRKAVAHVASLASGPPMDSTIRVNLHFHPDRIHGGESILASILRCGEYRSQFVTGTSNGGLTAYRGGDRWLWESRIFDRAYDDAAPSERPKYGALNFRARSTGASPRFGSGHLRLWPSTHERTTFCYPDSYYEPRDFGVASKMSLVGLCAAAKVADPLDAYIEAQVHGPLLIERDVEAIVLDPCYRDTQVEDLSRMFPFPIEWHTGFRLHVGTLRQKAEYRGLEFVELGETLARDGWLTPQIIGDAARAGRVDHQALKRVWHYVACFGDTAESGESG